MTRRLFLTEKHDQASVLAKALGGYEAGHKKRGFYDCHEGHRVVWAYGHLFRLKTPDEVNPDWADWRMEDLPLQFERFDYVIDDTGDLGKLKKRQIEVLQKSVHQYDEVVIATDDDREGEVIGWLPLTLLGYRGPIKRIVYSQIDPKALKIAVQKMHDATPYKGRYHAGMARTVTDFVLGLNLSRASTLTFGQNRGDLPTSAGRVQTPVLNLVAERCEAIEKFKSEAFYDLGISGTVDGASIDFIHAPEPKMMDRAEATAVLQSLPTNLPLQVSRSEKRRAPPKLFNLNNLQGTASSAFGYSPAQTLGVLNDLYLKGVLTYPRSEPRVLPESMSADTGALLYHLAKLPELETGGLAQLIKDHQFSYRREVYSDKEMAGHSHHAIIPNPNRIEATTLEISSLTPEQRNIFILVAKVFIAAHLPDYRYELVTASVRHNDREFKASMQTPLSEGWRAIYQEESDGEENDENEPLVRLPDVKDGDLLANLEGRVLDKLTRPPQFYSVKTLLSKMAELGLGAPSTFANYEPLLRARNYIGGTAKKVTVTPRGQESLKFWRLFTPQLTSPDLTVDIEQMLAAVSNGERTYHQVVEHVQNMALVLVDAVRTAPPGVVDLSRIQVSRPPSVKLKRHVRRSAERLGEKVSKDVLGSAEECSLWLDARKEKLDQLNSAPTEQQLQSVDAILNGNENLSYPPEDRADRQKVSAFLEAHLQDAQYPPSQKMLEFARSRAEILGIVLPLNAERFAARLKEWLKEHPVAPSQKQLQFAEKIAQALGLELPQNIRASSDICAEFIDGHLAQYNEKNPGGSKGGGKAGNRRRSTKGTRR